MPGESQGQRSLVDCPLWGRTESDTTEVSHTPLTEPHALTLFIMPTTMLLPPPGLCSYVPRPRFVSESPRSVGCSVRCAALFRVPASPGQLCSQGLSADVSHLGLVR